MMKLLGFLLAVLSTPFMAWSAYAEPSVVLECDTGGGLPGLHNLLDIDYGAATVRSHAINDDGAPYTYDGRPVADQTFQAKITDKVITWMTNFRGAQYFTLGRYSGVLTSQSHFQSTKGPEVITQQHKCHRWAPQVRQKKF